MLKTLLQRMLLGAFALFLLVVAADVLTYDPQPWLADYNRLKRDMAQGYANLDWMVEKRGVDLPDLDRRTMAELGSAHSRVRAFMALRGFVESFDDPHFRLKPAEQAGPPTESGAAANIQPDGEKADPPAGSDCAAAGYEEGDHAFRFPFARMPGWVPLRNGDFPTGLIGDTGVLRIGQFGEDQFLSACQAVFKPGLGEDALQHAVRARQQTQLRAAIRELKGKGARRLLVDVSGNGGGSEWVSEVVTLMTDALLTRREARLVDPACDRSGIWGGGAPPCPVLEGEPATRETLQGTGEWRGPVLILADQGTGSAAEAFVAWLQLNGVAKVIGERTAGAGCGYVDGGSPTRLLVVPVDVWMPNCARFLDDGTNEVEGIAPDIQLKMRDADPDAQVHALVAALG